MLDLSAPTAEQRCVLMCASSISSSGASSSSVCVCQYDGGAGAGTGRAGPAGAEVRRPGRCFTEGPAGNNLFHPGGSKPATHPKRSRSDAEQTLLFELTQCSAGSSCKAWVLYEHILSHSSRSLSPSLSHIHTLALTHTHTLTHTSYAN